MRRAAESVGEPGATSQASAPIGSVAAAQMARIVPAPLSRATQPPRSRGRSADGLLRWWVEATCAWDSSGSGVLTSLPERGPCRHPGNTLIFGPDSSARAAAAEAIRGTAPWLGSGRPLPGVRTSGSPRSTAAVRAHRAPSLPERSTRSRGRRSGTNRPSFGVGASLVSLKGGVNDAALARFVHVIQEVRP